MRVGVFTNLHKDTDLSVTRTLIRALRKNNVDVVLYEDLSGIVDGDEYFSVNRKCRLDFIVSVGGDGTILRIAKYCAGYSIPIIGVNLGHVGFLAEVEPTKIDEFVNKLIGGKFSFEERSLLTVNVGNSEFSALNDVVLMRSVSGKMADVGVSVGSEFLDEYFCDGFIVSTPTGSTAYSLSAGGPILSPSVNAFALTPINSHSLHSRPVVASDRDVITLHPMNGVFSLTVDGVLVREIEGGCDIAIRKSDKPLLFVRVGGNGFYSKLLAKLNKWSVTDKE